MPPEKPVVAPVFPTARAESLMETLLQPAETQDPGVRKAAVKEFTEIFQLPIDPNREPSFWATYFRLRGEFFNLSLDKKEAEDAFKKAVEYLSTEVLANVQLAQLARERNEKFAEKLHLRRATLEQAPPGRAQRAQVRAFAELLPLVDDEEAFAVAKRQLEFFPGAVAWEIYTERAWRAKKWLELGRALPKVSDTWPRKDYFQGELHFVRKKYAEAVASLQKFLARPATDITRDLINPAKERLCSTHAERRQWNEAKVCLEDALQADPTREALLKAYESVLGARANTLAELQAALSFAPQSWWLRSEILSRLVQDPTQLGAAQLVVDQLVVLDAQRPETLYWKGRLAFEKKIFSEADKDFSQLLLILRGGNAQDGNIAFSDYWIFAARNERARGHTQEGRELLEEGLRRSSQKKDRDALAREIRNNP